MLRRLTTRIQDEWDGYLSAGYYPVVCLLFVLVVVYTGWYGQKLAEDWEQWTIAEWLISYAPGFVRRGLSGELLLSISRYSGWPANQMALGTFVLLFAAFFVLFAFLLRRKRMTFWYFVLCLSPGFVLFTFYNASAVGRKESLTYVVFTAWALWSAGRRQGLGFQVGFGVLSFLLTLMHEMFFFSTPYFVLLSFLEARREGDGRRWIRSLSVPACSGVALLLILGFSASLNAPALCDRLLQIGAPAKVCGGVLEYHHLPPMEALRDFAGGLNGTSVLGLGLVFPIVLIPLAVFSMANAGETISPIRLVVLETIVILLSGPLFVLAVDWGRWISIHVIMLTITCAVLLRDRSQPRPVRRPFSAASVVSLAVGGLVLSSMLTWSITYCCGANLVTPFGPVEALVGVWDEF